MKKLLYLVHRLPYPPNKGDKIASFNLLKFLATRYQIYLGCFIDDKVDWQYVDELKNYCADTCVVGLNPQLSKILSLRGLLSGEALSLPYYRNKQLQTWVDHTLEEQRIDSVVVFSGVMAQYVSAKLPLKGHSVLDLVDVDSDKWRLYAEDHKWPLSWLYQRESKKLLAYESAMAEAFDATVFVSEEEAEYFKTLVPAVSDKVIFRVQGVDSQFFNPALDCESPYPADTPVFVFAGAMDYWPNVHAAMWFAKSVFPGIRKQIKNARFYVVGMNPGNEVVKLSDIEGVYVTGSVDDIRPYVRCATISVAPLRIARGIQNKVLEAMAMAKPVLATTNALQGIRRDEGFSPLIADDEVQMLKGALALLSGDVVQDVQCGRACVLAHYNWDTNLRRIEDLLLKGL